MFVGQVPSPPPAKILCTIYDNSLFYHFKGVITGVFLAVYEGQELVVAILLGILYYRNA